MAVSRALRRLLRIRELEEEQSRLALESALGELNRLKHALTATAERDRRGRRLVEASAQRASCRTGWRASKRRARPTGWRGRWLRAFADAELDVAARREEFLAQEGGTPPGRDPDRGDRGAGCPRRRPARPAGAGRLVSQPAAQDGGGGGEEGSGRLRGVKHGRARTAQELPAGHAPARMH